MLFAFQKNFPSVDDKLLAVWKLEAPTAWFFTFTNEDVVSQLCDIGGFDGAQGRSHPIIFLLATNAKSCVKCYGCRYRPQTRQSMTIYICSDSIDNIT